MAQRQKIWARKQRQLLLALLSPTCRKCGSTEELTFDCIIPMGHDHHRKDTSARMSFYRAMLRVGNLQILCASCNARKGDNRSLLTQTVWQKLRNARTSHQRTT